MVSALDSRSSSLESRTEVPRCHTLLSQCLSSPRCINGCEFTARGNPAMDQHPIQWGVEILLVTFCSGNQDKLWPDGPLGSNADLTVFYIISNILFFNLFSL